MKKNYNRIDKLQITLGIFGVILLIISFTNKSFEWLTNIVFLIIAINLIIIGIKSYKDSKTTLFSSVIILAALTIIGFIIFKI
ncbi:MULTISPECIES: hypothetical protein [unclassified Lysinibacillus]|uniref:hypothetical protein n=1 Tax=unclassified Lysinibacillus TaxID=2636778 RepID=UPI00201B3B77|nr:MULTISPECIES: hypothetical protein [unclassified Lysinibacillus]